jgi:hypothetical protein
MIYLKEDFNRAKIFFLGLVDPSVSERLAYFLLRQHALDVPSSCSVCGVICSLSTAQQPRYFCLFQQTWHRQTDTKIFKYLDPIMTTSSDVNHTRPTVLDTSVTTLMISEHGLPSGIFVLTHDTLEQTGQRCWWRRQRFWEEGEDILTNILTGEVSLDFIFKVGSGFPCPSQGDQGGCRQRTSRQRGDRFHWRTGGGHALQIPTQCGGRRLWRLYFVVECRRCGNCTRVLSDTVRTGNSKQIPHTSLRLVNEIRRPDIPYSLLTPQSRATVCRGLRADWISRISKVTRIHPRVGRGGMGRSDHLQCSTVF